MPPVDYRLLELERKIVQLAELEKRLDHVEAIQSDMIRWLRRTSRCVKWAWGLIGVPVFGYYFQHFFLPH